MAPDDNATGVAAVLEIDWKGAGLVRTARQDAVSIFILPPSQEALRQRLQHRAQDEPQVIEARLAEARSEMRHYREFDYLVINDEFEAALEDLRSIVRCGRLARDRQGARHRELIASLLV